MKQSAEWGANKERTAILAKVRRMVRELKEVPAHHFEEAEDILKDLLTWLLQRNERYQKRKGGLGR